MPNFIQLTSPLILHADPILPSHAATKQYVDNKRNNVNASSFTTGLITTARMPALTGDVTSVAGSGVISLNTNGVTVGTYAKVTVDATGRVTAGGTLAAADIATVSWTKITSGKPTTAAGYGITNLISLSGGTASGNITSTATPSAALHAVTKGYVDNAITGVVSASLSTGDVIRKTATVAPTGFLRCNGGVVNRTTYAGLFAIVGSTYVKATAVNSAGVPWLMQYDFNTTQTDSIITGWSSGTAFPTSVSSACSLVTKNRVYILGGRIDEAAISFSAVYTAPINADGTLGAWATGTSLPIALDNSQVVVTKNRVYLLGGITNTTTTSAVYTAPINADGTLGTWTVGNSLPTAFRASQAISTSSRVYTFGGYTGSAHISSVYSAVINADGTLGTWTETSLPVAMSFSNAAVVKDRVYLLGGNPGGNPTTAIYVAPINADGTLGTWSTSTPLVTAVMASTTIVTKNRVYLMGGYANGVYGGTNFTAPINTDGTLGTWTSAPISGIPQLHLPTFFITSSKLFMVGGYGTGNAYTYNTVYSAPFLGGFNDYTNYSTQITTAATDFTLPDFSSLEKNSLNYFIKT